MEILLAKDPRQAATTWLPGAVAARRWRGGNAPGPRGFALVVTISLLVLLTVVAVGLLTLSSIAVRTGGQAAAQAEARANARLALLLAIGDLQKQLGPDQRVSANAAILADPEAAGEPAGDEIAHPQWLGVWDSFAGDNRYIAGKHTHDDLVPDLSPHRGDSFRRWIISAAADDASGAGQAAALDFAGSGDGGDFIELLGAGTFGAEGGDDLRPVRAPRVGLRHATGRPGGSFAYWVGDESQKACLRPGRDEKDLDDPLELLAERDAPSSPAEEMFGQFDGPADHALLGRAAVSRRTLDFLPNARDLGRLYHHLTVRAHSVLADVREGGLKRDLNLLGDTWSADIDQPDALPVSEENMLYDFSEGNTDRAHLRVPLHDLLVYYQLYKLRRNDGGDVLQVRGGGTARPFIEPASEAEFPGPRGVITNIYRQAVATKLQVAVWARAERTDDEEEKPYRLKIRLTPVLTLWNPYNVPLRLVGDLDFEWWSLAVDLGIFEPGRATGETASLGAIGSGVADESVVRQGAEYSKMMLMYTRVDHQSTLAPGESRVYSLDRIHAGRLGGSYGDFRFLKPGYRPLSGVEVDYEELAARRRGDTGPAPAFRLAPGEIREIGFAPLAQTLGNLGMLHSGSPFSIYKLHRRHGSGERYIMEMYRTRRSQYEEAQGWQRTISQAQRDFLRNVYNLGERFDGRLRRNPDTGTTFEVRPYSVSELATSEGQLLGTLSFGYCGESEVLNDSYGGNRRFPCRPFLHSLPTASMHWVKDLTPRDIYITGVRWRFEDGDEADNEITAAGPYGRFGGGWSAADGQRHAVQFEIPQRPFHSLAQFNHAMLGGWSLAPEWDDLHDMQLRAEGAGGLYPAMSMPVGNSYALPLLDAGRAFRDAWHFRFLDEALEAYLRDRGMNIDSLVHAPLVDHSYLANHALWDEFFMSSICDHTRGLYQLAAGESHRLSASTIAAQLFGPDAEPAPNHRLVPAAGTRWEDLRPLLFRGRKPTPEAERIITRYLLLQGGFNVNSTSKEAWKTVLASLHNAPTPVLGPGESGFSPTLEPGRGETPVGAFSLPAGPPLNPDDPSRADPSNPAQWVGSFTLTDDQIDTLAGNIVREVRRRGPFLSLSDFINRRLAAESDDRDLALYGALQAAIEAGGLNDAFHQNRSADLAKPSEFLRANRLPVEPFAFPEAARGPVAYGSTAYLDQADLLRAIDATIVPRGDTFVVRAYGDATDAKGQVIARAWCEATVQRAPAYLDPADPPETRAADLTSPANKDFGRRFQLVSFRWLPPDEV